ncbi:MAG: alkaline phosphatase D family protein [Solirubrobacterales bacterium]
MAELILGPLLRYVGTTDASVWVETDAACEVEVLGRSTPTFCVEGHHYALVLLEDLEPGSSQEYEVALDGERAWPPEGSEFPPSVLRTFRSDEQVELVFGSCRVAAPHGPPFTLPKEVDAERGRGFDALHALALSILDSDSPAYPDLLFLCGDQVYADEVSPRTLEFIAERDDRPPDAPPDQVADFEEYTRLYRESWSEPVIRWLLSTVSSSMVIDDHDMHDDWNISRSWCEDMEELEWWRERVVGGMTAYWIYQFAGNLSPADLRDRVLWNRVQENRDDAAGVLREFMEQDDQEREGKRWSYHRDLGTTRLIVADVRTGRCLDEGERKIVDDDEWEWIAERATEDEFDHLLIGTSDPYLLAPAFHHLEAWSERVCDGEWGRAGAVLGERLRRALDFDHWGAFGDSFERLTNLLGELAAGEHGTPPATIGVLSGDVHHAYLAEVAFRRGSGAQSFVYQAVCSPYRNALDTNERRAIRVGISRPAAAVTRALAKAANAPDPGIRWRFREGPYFDNQVATLKLDGRSCELVLDKVKRDPEGRDEALERVFEHRLS